MANGSATVLHGCREGVHVLRFVGDVRYPIAPSLTEFLTHTFAAEPITGFVLDLTETTSIDSTNLGLIARLGVRVKERCGRPATVVASDGDIRALLDSMGIGMVCELAERGPDGDQATTAIATTEPLEQDQLARVMLDAHRALADLSRTNRERFDSVVEALERATKGS